MNIVTNESLNKLIESLQGRSMSLCQACENCGFDKNDLTAKQLDEIDNWIFCCPGCGWWCDRGEAHNVNGEDYCEDCYEDMNY